MPPNFSTASVAFLYRGKGSRYSSKDVTILKSWPLGGIINEVATVQRVIWTVFLAQNKQL